MAMLSQRSTYHAEKFRYRHSDGYERTADFGPRLYALVFCLAFSLLYLIGKSGLFSWAMLLFNIVWLLVGGPSIYPLCSSFFISNELASFASIVAWYLLNRDKRDIHRDRIANLKVDKPVVVMACLILAVSYFQSANLGTVVNTIASSVYIGFLLFLIYSLKGVYDKIELYPAIRLFAISEVVVSLLMVVKVGLNPGDSHTGTLGNAHFFGLSMCILLFLLAYYRRVSGRKLNMGDCALYLLIGFSLYEADAKAVIVAGIICVLFLWLIRTLGKRFSAFRYDLAIFLVFTTALVVCLSLVIQSDVVKSTFLSEDFPLHDMFAESIYNDSLGLNKTEYFSGTITDMFRNGHIVMGYGLGQYGSRFANLFGYTYTYRESSALNQLVSQIFSSHMIPEYAAYASQYNDEVVKAIRWYSAVMTYPFSSFIALIGEMGLLGVILLTYLAKSVRVSPIAATCIAYFYGACIVDMYFDHIQLIGLVILVIMAMPPTETGPKPDSRTQWLWR